ncbi:MAG: ribosome assembly RNA-binding protein YhbY [Clostridiaceae bacterium]
MLTSKQRSYLRSLANTMNPIFNIGKGGIEENLLKQLEEALEARELIKIAVLNNSDLTSKEAIQIISEKIKCEPVQAIGNKMVIYKRSKDKPKIELPK